MMDKQDKKKDNKPNYYDERWYENSVVVEGIGCLVQVALAGMGCCIPMTLFILAMCGSRGLVHRLQHQHVLLGSVQRSRLRRPKRVQALALRKGTSLSLVSTYVRHMQTP